MYCINSSGCFLTTGKFYDVISIYKAEADNEYTIVVINDRGEKEDYWLSQFSGKL